MDYESGSTKVLTLKSTLNPDQSSSTTLLEIGLFDEGLKKKHFPGHCLDTKYLLRLKSRIFLVTLSLYYVIVVLRFKLNKNIHIQKTKNL